MFRIFRRGWKRWQGWTLPTKLSVASAMVTICLIPFAFVDIKPPVSQWLWPSKPRQVPLVSVRIDNPGETDQAVSYRGEFWLWLAGSAEGAPHLPGTYEIVASDAGPVQPGMVMIPAGRTTKVLVKVMNQERLYAYLERGDTDLTILFPGPTVPPSSATNCRSKRMHSPNTMRLRMSWRTESVYGPSFEVVGSEDLCPALPRTRF